MLLFRLRVFWFLYTVFTFLHVLGCFSIIVCFRFVLDILYELMP